MKVRQLIERNGQRKATISERKVKLCAQLCEQKIDVVSVTSAVATCEFCTEAESSLSDRSSLPEAKF
jgi:hypothetical protein